MKPATRPQDRSSALAVTLDGFTKPPHTVPLLVVDLGLRDLAKARQVLECAASEGLTRVATLDGEIYPAAANWTYSYSLGDTHTSGTVTIYLNSSAVFASAFQVTQRWADLEGAFEFALLAFGTINLSEVGANPQAQVAQLLARLDAGAVLGATIARDARHRSSPLFVPRDW